MRHNQIFVFFCSTDILSEDVLEEETLGAKAVKTLFQSCTLHTGGRLDDGEATLHCIKYILFSLRHKRSSCSCTLRSSWTYLEYKQVCLSWSLRKH